MRVYILSSKCVPFGYMGYAPERWALSHLTHYNRKGSGNVLREVLRESSIHKSKQAEVLLAPFEKNKKFNLRGPVGRMLSLYVTELDSILGTSHGVLSPPRVILQHRDRCEPWTWLGMLFHPQNEVKYSQEMLLRERFFMQIFFSNLYMFSKSSLWN